MKTITRARLSDERSQRDNGWLVERRLAGTARTLVSLLHTNAVHELRSVELGTLMADARADPDIP